MNGYPLLIAVSLALAPGAAGAEVDAAWRATGQARPYKPVTTLRPLSMRLAVPLSARLRTERISAFAADPEGSRHRPGTATNVALRVGAIFQTADAFSPIFFTAEYEHDLLTGQVAGGGGPLDAPLRSAAGETDQQLRKAYGRLTVGPLLTLTGGFMTSHWGLGLLSNDGDHGWTPGSALISDPREGDRVLRGAVATGPWTSARVLVTAAYDRVEGDDVLLPGDRATQLIAAAILNYDRPSTAGIYLVRREQEARDGKLTRVTVADLYGRWRRRVGSARGSAEIEAALITGDTELAPSAEHPKGDVFQLGAAARMSLDFGHAGALLDVLYASGDRNLDDGVQNGFKADPNFEMGMLLFRHVLTSTTARAAVRAADPGLVGVPAEDLDRYPTREQPTNTWSFFPRGYYRPISGLELYGGPLFAFSEVALADPRESRFAGGDPRGPYGGAPGSYLGTELDAGVRYTALFSGAELNLGLEGATLLPGGAFNDAKGETLGAVSGARILAALRL